MKIRFKFRDGSEDIDLTKLKALEADQRARLKEAEELERHVRSTIASEQRRIRRQKGAKGSKQGGRATADKFARPKLDELLRGYVARNEPIPVKQLEDQGIKKSALYERIARIKAEKK